MDVLVCRVFLSGGDVLYTIKKEPIDYIPYEPAYRLWRSQLTDAEYNAIVEELNRRVDGKNVITASWVPGADWTGTPFEPIYYKACNEDFELSGKCFGLFFWVVMMQRQEAWAFGRYDKDGIPIKSLVYFRIEL
jgi:hypothetical protein